MKNKKNKKIFLLAFFVGIFFATAFFLTYETTNILAVDSYPIPGNSVSTDPTKEGIIHCGRPGQTGMCTLCDLIGGINNVVQYIMKIAIFVALLIMAVGGVMYIVSAGESAMMESAKSAMKNAAIGFVIIFAAFMIINTALQYLGSTKNAAGEPTLGITITSWGQFDCTAQDR